MIIYIMKKYSTYYVELKKKIRNWKKKRYSKLTNYKYYIKYKQLLGTFLEFLWFTTSSHRFINSKIIYH